MNTVRNALLNLFVTNPILFAVIDFAIPLVIGFVAGYAVFG